MDDYLEDYPPNPAQLVEFMDHLSAGSEVKITFDEILWEWRTMRNALVDAVEHREDKSLFVDIMCHAWEDMHKG